MALVLIVDDDDSIRQVCRMWLSSTGHRVLEARDGLEARRVLQNEPVDILISDVDMPGLDGTELVSWWRCEQRSSKPVVMLTASSDRREVAKEMKQHEVALMPKPFSPGTLVDTVSLLLGEAQE